mgnify:FL=1
MIKCLLKAPSVVSYLLCYQAQAVTDLVDCEKMLRLRNVQLNACFKFSAQLHVHVHAHVVCAVCEISRPFLFTVCNVGVFCQIVSSNSFLTDYVASVI